MSKILQYVGGTVVLAGIGASALWYAKRMQGGATPLPEPGPDTPVPTPAPGPPKDPAKLEPISWQGAAPMPVPADVKGDLTRNWGTTPEDLKPLLLTIEEVTGIVGAARILGIVGFQESGFNPTAQNSDESERNASWRGYYNNKDRNPPLIFGEAAANFGSGGLFAGLAPYALWSAVQEMKDKAPLLGSDPRILFLPRVAAFAAAVYLSRLLKHYEIRDHADIKVGWGSISLLSENGRKDSDYARIRQKFLEDAKKLGIDLTDTQTIPTKLSASDWPGAKAVFDKLVITLPTPKKVVVT
jgi:hypothetical protein